MRILVTSGPTREMIDPVRFISNLSSGKMGHALAAAAAEAGFDVILVNGPGAAPPPAIGSVEIVPVVSAADMAAAAIAAFPSCAGAILAAAVADYRPAEPARQKIKKGGPEMLLRLVRNVDIAAELGARKRPGQVIVGFAAETERVLDNAAAKLVAKNMDWIAANDVSGPEPPFGSDDNDITLLSAAGLRLPLGRRPKAELARAIVAAAFGHLDSARTPRYLTQGGLPQAGGRQVPPNRPLKMPGRSSMSDVLHLDAASFDAAVAQGVILVDFWAEWCGPCRMLGPVLEQVAQEVAGKAKVAKVNVDECPDLAAKYQVRSIPALFIIKDGQIVKNFVGVKDKKTLVDAIAASL